MLQDGDLLPDLLGKIVKWLGQHAHMGTRNKGEISKSTKPTKSERRSAICTEGMVMLDSDILNPTCTPAENCIGNGVVADEAKANSPVVKNGSSGNLPSDHSSEEQVSPLVRTTC